MTEYTEVGADAEMYDSILDDFQKGTSSYVRVEVPDTDPRALYSSLADRITARNLASTIRVTLLGNKVYLQKH
jgi:hypothetical protein